MRLLTTNRLQTSRVYYNSIPLRFRMLHICGFYAAFLAQVVFFCFFFSASSSFSFSISVTRASISLDSKIWKRKVTFKWKTSTRARARRYRNPQQITFSGWFLLMTASSMFFPPDWTTWERTDDVSSQPNSPLRSLSRSQTLLQLILKNFTESQM